MTNNVRKAIFGDAGNIMKQLDQFFIGYDGVFDHMTKQQDTFSKSNSYYPPYNIRKTNETTYVIELALAGFKKNEIDIEVKDNILTIKSVNKQVEPQEVYIYRGIAKRDFTRTFALNEQVDIQGASLEDGMLKITLERVIPDHEKPRKIEIKSREQLAQVERQLLV